MASFARFSFPLLTFLLLIIAGPTTAQDKFPPPPRPLPRLEEDAVPFPSPDFERALQKLKTEREALDAEWKALARPQGIKPPAGEAEDLEWAFLLKQTLRNIQQRKKSAPPPASEAIDPKAEPGAKEAKKKDDATRDAQNNVAPTDGAVPLDPLLIGHALLRAEKHDEALESFRQVDLKEKKAEERAPIQLLMAHCLLHLGKHEEAVDLLREVANSRADERVAAYAQWQLEMHRWKQDVRGRLENVRQRRLALEKQP